MCMCSRTVTMVYLTHVLSHFLLACQQIFISQQTFRAQCFLETLTYLLLKTHWNWSSTYTFLLCSAWFHIMSTIADKDNKTDIDPPSFELEACHLWNFLFDCMLHYLRVTRIFLEYQLRLMKTNNFLHHCPVCHLSYMPYKCEHTHLRSGVIRYCL